MQALEKRLEALETSVKSLLEEHTQYTPYKELADHIPNLFRLDSTYSSTKKKSIGLKEILRTNLQKINNYTKGISNLKEKSNSHSKAAIKKRDQSLKSISKRITSLENSFNQLPSESNGGCFETSIKEELSSIQEHLQNQFSSQKNNILKKLNSDLKEVQRHSQQVQDSSETITRKLQNYETNNKHKIKQSEQVQPSNEEDVKHWIASEVSSKIHSVINNLKSKFETNYKQTTTDFNSEIIQLRENVLQLRNSYFEEVEKPQNPQELSQFYLENANRFIQQLYDFYTPSIQNLIELFEVLDDQISNEKNMTENLILEYKDKLDNYREKMTAIKSKMDSEFSKAVECTNKLNWESTNISNHEVTQLKQKQEQTKQEMISKRKLLEESYYSTENTLSELAIPYNIKIRNDQPPALDSRPVVRGESSSSDIDLSSDFSDSSDSL